MTKERQVRSTEEALKLAIDRLEWFVDAYPHDIAISKEEFLRPFKEALAQPAVAEQHKQEPVAVVVQVQHPAAVALKLKADVPVGTTLYTTPPQRTWVGLDPEEIRKTNHHMVEGAYHYSFKQGAEWAEAKLKEKNT